MNWREYVRDGPGAGGNSARRRLLGFYLHWRTWALVAVVLVGFLGAGWLVERYGASVWMLVWAVGALTNEIANEVGGS